LRPRIISKLLTCGVPRSAAVSIGKKNLDGWSRC
jgi:hypothetical protein